MRGAKQQNIALQERDLELLRGLFESRVMTLAHAGDLFFDSKPQAAKKRVQKLKSRRRHRRAAQGGSITHPCCI